MLSCKPATALLSQAQDGKLGFLAQWQLRLHLMACDGCTQFGRQLQFLRKALQALPEREQDPPEAP